MQRTETMTTVETIFSAGVSAVAAWLVASVTKVNKAEHKEAMATAKEQHEKLLQRVAVLERDLTGRMTRAEFDYAFNKVEGLVRQFQLEARAEFKELKSELKTKT